MKRKYYIAYGSNLNVNQMARRCPHAVQVGVATIKNYRLTFRGNGYAVVANIEPCVGESVPVGVWEIGPSDEKALDRYEGFPRLYEKQTFIVLVNGREIEAMAYIMTPGHEIWPPTWEYFTIIMKGYTDFGFEDTPLLLAADRAVRGEEN